MNNIKKIRSEIIQYFNPDRFIENSRKTSEALTENYYLTSVQYRQNKPNVNWTVTKINIYAKNTNEKIFDLILDNGHFFHEWVTKDGCEYLLCPENLCGGQTVIDLTHRKMKSFASPDDGFIWTRFYVSPDGNKLAVIGCFWAAPYEIRIYDFSNPLNLPLPEIDQISLLENEKDNLEWLDNERIKTTSYQGTEKSHKIKT